MLTGHLQPAYLDTTSPVRSRSRFQIHASCRFWWTSRLGTLNFGFGTTRNVSSGGVWICAEGAPTMGAAILVEIDLILDASPELFLADDSDSCSDFNDSDDGLGAGAPAASAAPAHNLHPASERVLRVEGQVVRHEHGHGGFAVMATHTSIEASSLVLEGLV